MSKMRAPSLFAAALVGTVLMTWTTWMLLGDALTRVGASSQAVQKLQFVSWYWPYVRPEPLENLLFAIAVLSGGVFFTIAGRRSADSARRVSLPLTTCLIVVAAGFVAYISRTEWNSLFSSVPTDLVSSSAAQPGVFASAVVVVAAVIWAATRAAASRKSQWIVAATFCVAMLATLSSMVILSDHDDMVTGWHYEVFVYPIVQDWLGKALTLDQKSQYGLYPLFLRPVWLLIGAPNSVSVSSVMALLLFISNSAIVIFMCRFARNKPVALAFALLAVFYAALAVPFWPQDPYFQFRPVRELFPAMALLMMCGADRKRFVGYFIVAVGLLWNFESGVVALAGYLVYGIALRLPGQRPSMFASFAAKQLGLLAAAIAIAGALFVVYYLYRFGTPPSFVDLFLMLRVFSVGYGALPMPVFGGWIFHALIYAAAIFVGMQRLKVDLDRKDREQAAALLAIASMGIVWLRYYQGRSVSVQLMLASLPAICCLGLIADIALNNLSRNPKNLARILSVIVAAPLAASFAVWQLDDPLPQRQLRSLAAAAPVSELDRAAGKIVADFLSIKSASDDQLLVVSPIAHLVQMKLGVANPMDFTGMRQIILESELDEIASALNDTRTKMFVLNDSRIAGDPKIRPVLRDLYSELQSEDHCQDDPASNWTYVRRDVAFAAPRNESESPSMNQAVGKISEQSSSLGAASATLAVDGVTGGDFYLGSVSHTVLQVNPWWQVDLGEIVEINSIRVWNRTDCCTERLKDFWLFVSDRPFNSKATLRDLRVDPEVAKRFVTTSPCPNIAIDSPAPLGRYVRLQLQSKNYLSLAEVQVLAAPAGPKKKVNLGVSVVPN